MGADASAPAPADTAGGALGEAGSGALASAAPNMFGDARGSPVRATIVIPATPGTPAVNVNFPGAAITAPFTATASIQALGIVTFTAQNSYSRFGTAFPSGTTFTSAAAVATAGGTSTVSPIALAQNSQDTTAARNFAIATFGPGGTLTYLQNQSVATFLSHGVSSPSVYLLDPEYNYFIPGTPGTPARVLIQQILNVPNPSAGGTVGRTKISDDNSPLPRDRVTLNYDYFDNVPLGLRGSGIHRFTPAIEKTFLDQYASVELRLPFAATISGDVTTNGITTDRVAFGNISLIFKGLLYSDQIVNVAAGLGATLPTADDNRVLTPAGTELVRIRNQALILTPYAAALFTPNDRLFAQAWVQFGFDTNGNPVDANPDFTTLRPVGKLNDMTLAQLDGQIGYWIYRAPQRDTTLQGLAPFLELHYNSQVGTPDVITAGGFRIGDFSHLDELNLGAGLVAQIGNNINLAFGAVFPLKTAPNRTFDYQLGIHGTIFFGPTARSRNPAAQVSTF
jgi:hypothetical protein